MIVMTGSGHMLFVHVRAHVCLVCKIMLVMKVTSKNLLLVCEMMIMVIVMSWHLLFVCELYVFV